VAILLNQSTRPPVVQTVGVTQPNLYGIISAPDGGTIVWNQGDTVTFFMRPLLSRVPVVSGAATTISPADSEGHNVLYAWQSSDVALEGEFMGWWGYVPFGGSLAETPEFRVIITDHGPGYGSPTGVVVDGLSMSIPITAERLRQAPEFGDRFLQAHADYVKRIVMGVVVSPDLEVEYDPALVEYLSKRTALRLISGPAQDYWARQYRQVSAQNPSEQATYPDMLQSLETLRRRLGREVVQDWRQLQYLVPGLPQLRVEPAPASSLGHDHRRRRPVTRDPNQTRREETGGPRWDLFLP
jgi:hypothetical protein